MEQLYDVIIYEIETGRVDSIVGKRMRLHGGFHNAEKRTMTVLERLNDRYTTAIVDAGVYNVGDTYRDEEG